MQHFEFLTHYPCFDFSHEAFALPCLHETNTDSFHKLWKFALLLTIPIALAQLSIFGSLI